MDLQVAVGHQLQGAHHLVIGFAGIITIRAECDCQSPFSAIHYDVGEDFKITDPWRVVMAASLVATTGGATIS